jgi:hypothetical protein
VSGTQILPFVAPPCRLAEKQNKSRNAVKNLAQKIVDVVIGPYGLIV